MKKFLLSILALTCLGAANAQGRLEVGGGIGAAGAAGQVDAGDGMRVVGLSNGPLPAAQVVVHAPDLMGPVGLRGMVGVNMIWMFPMPNVGAGLTYPIYREENGLQSYVYGGAGTYFSNDLYGDLGVEVSFPVGKNLRVTGDFGAMVVSGGATPKAFVGVKTSF